MWTPPALASEARPWSGDIWRVVESQSRVATLKLVDTLDEQAVLEAELEGGKPLVVPGNYDERSTHYGSSAVLVQRGALTATASLGYAASTRIRRRAWPARPYICRFTVLTRLI